MFDIHYRYQCHFVNMFIISIIFLGLVACVSPPYSKTNEVVESKNRPESHKVIPGDTLFSIAWRYGIKYQDLAKYNKISKPYRIYPNQIIRLSVPPGMYNKSNTPVKAAAKERSSYSKKFRSNNQSKAISNDKKAVLRNGAPGWHWPSKGTILKHFSGASTLDKGIDIKGKLGEPVLAAASGQVVYAGTGLRGYGRLVIIKHDEVFLSAYAHNSRLLVSEGDVVKAGQKIADMGSSGTNEVKLHFEIRRDGTPEDPLKYLPKR